MKYLIFLFLISTTCFSSCRKKVLREVATIETIGPIHCTNGVFDEDEIGLDCGGLDCDSCIQLVAPCTLNTDEIVYYNGLSTTTKSFTTKSMTVNGSSYSFIAYTSPTDYLQLVFSGKPDITTIFDATNDNSFLGSTEVYVIYSQNAANDLYGQRDVYVNYENGVYRISSCDIGFKTWGGTEATWVTQTFNVTFN